jgi:hypothetical protein
MMKTEASSLAAFDGMTEQSIAAFAWADARPLQGAVGFLDWRLCGDVSALLVAGHFVGHAREALLMPAHGRLLGHRVFLFGLGSWRDATDEGVAAVAGDALSVCARARAGSLLVLAPQQVGTRDFQPAFVRGLPAAEVVRVLL